MKTLLNSFVPLLWLLSGAIAAPLSAAPAEPAKAQITVLYDAFGKTSNMQKDWGFSAFVEYGGKRILFDTGNPKENFGVFGAALPGTFYKRDESLPAEMRYFDGKPPETLRFGSAWPQGNFEWITETTEVAPGFHLILLKGPWGVDLDVMEISLAIDTPEGIVLVVGCSHPTLEKIVEAAKAAINKPIHLVFGGTHLLPAKPDEIKRIATALRDNWKVAWIAPVHCTGEPAFAGLKQSFGDRYLYAGLGVL